MYALVPSLHSLIVLSCCCLEYLADKKSFRLGTVGLLTSKELSWACYAANGHVQAQSVAFD